ncbi:MAG: pyruvate kinase [Bacteroidetes bacterium]|nr:pyruvate kinase [Bacteroidota bacterium]
MLNTANLDTHPVRRSWAAKQTDVETKKNLLKVLKPVYDKMLQAEAQKEELLHALGASRRKSAVNLIDYMALRSFNIEPVQEELHRSGLSSLASSESHIKFQLLQVMRWLGHEGPETSEVNYDRGTKLLNDNITTLLGEADHGSVPPIMVTFDTNFVEDPDLICELLRNGMKLARINCAHDDEDTWLKMIGNLQKARTQTGLPCKIYMDIAGPKIRTKVVRKGKHQNKLKVEVGQEILLSEPGKKAVKGKAFICCTLPGIVRYLRKGQRVLIDDGLFGAIVTETAGDEALIKIIRISSGKPVIKSEKGLNFPDTEFEINPVTEYDVKCLPFIVKHADMLGFSFVTSAADMQLLRNRLESLNCPDFPVIAKIETGLAVNNLPDIILQGMKQEKFGVMVARGDLAIEIGFERMSEIQDEILWICEAAHVPAIWATQVLETMNKRGIATRGEITDAVHAASADCVMLNKGEHIVEVLRTLNNILARSRKNSFKNRRLFRKLSIAEKFLG